MGAVILNQFIIVKCAALLVGLSTILALEFLLVQLDFCCQSLFSNNFFQIRVRLVLDMVFFVAQLSLSLNFMLKKSFKPWASAFVFWNILESLLLITWVHFQVLPVLISLFILAGPKK